MASFQYFKPRPKPRYAFFASWGLPVCVQAEQSITARWASPVCVQQNKETLWVIDTSSYLCALVPPEISWEPDNNSGYVCLSA